LGLTIFRSLAALRWLFRIMKLKSGQQRGFFFFPGVACVVATGDGEKSGKLDTGKYYI
jgi:hypothetical protein